MLNLSFTGVARGFRKLFSGQVAPATDGPSARFPGKKIPDSPTCARVLVCTNLRRRPRSCGNRCNTSRIARHLEKLLRATPGAGPVRVVRTGCLGRCPLGPVLAIYPGGFCYTYADERDIDDIVSEHLAKGRPVERLLLPQAHSRC
jgi:(2Fe-2S) ferredoxin